VKDPGLATTGSSSHSEGVRERNSFLQELARAVVGGKTLVRTPVVFP
jgi:hypothetical protein